MDTEVLIVGAGPVGLTCSILLSWLGVANRVVERREGLHASPQAHVVSARTMEIFRAAGMDEGGLRAISTPPGDLASVQWVHSLAGPELGRFLLATPERIGKMLSCGPAPMANISQHRLEPVLLEDAQARGGAVDFLHDWQDMEQDAEGVTSRVVSLATGETETVRSRFLIGCDGAGSRVRRALDIAMTGPDRVETFLNVHLAANLRPLVRERPAILYWRIDPEEPGVFVAHDIDSTWVYMHPYDPDEQPPEHFDEEVCRGLVARALGADRPFEILSIDPWVMTAQVAEHYGEGSVFLAGDSAHRFPPTGGLGMNTGVADAFNLCWKLAAVRDGRAGARLLASYESERRSVARRNCDVSLSNHLKMHEVVDALGLSSDLDAEEARARIRSLPNEPDRARHVQEVIERQVEHFDTTGLDLGYCYEEGALVPDGTPPPAPQNAVTDYAASTRPGSRLPHAWVVRDGERISTLDLLDPRAPVLLTGSQGGPWREAAEALGLVACGIGEGCEVQDSDGGWAAQREISSAGAVLVRPDAHVAWRAMRSVPDARAVLRDTLTRVLPD